MIVNDERTLELLVKLAESGQAGAIAGIFQQNQELALRNRQITSATLTGTLLYGQGGLFTMCADDALINASLQDQGLAAAIPWLPTRATVRRQPLLTHMGMLEDDTEPTDQCEDPESAYYRTCEIEWCLGRIRRKSEPYDRLDIGMLWCENQPIYRLFGSVTVGGEVIAPMGTMIANDAEWGAVTAAAAIRQRLGHWLYVGNRAVNVNMFDGLQTLVNTGYTDLATTRPCEAVDSELKTYGYCIGATNAPNIYNYLDALVTRIIQRATGAGFDPPKATDMLIVAPSPHINALYEYWACSLGPCGTLPVGSTATMRVDAAWARNTADDLRKRGVLRIHGMDIPVLADDYQPLVEGNENEYWADIYVLTLQLGGRPIVFGEHQDFSAGIGDAITGYSQELYGGRVTDGGRFYVWQERTNTCFDTRVALKPRLVILAPFVQGRLEDVCASTLQEPVAPPPSPYAFTTGRSVAWDYTTTCL